MAKSGRNYVLGWAIVVFYSGFEFSSLNSVIKLDLIFFRLFNCLFKTLPRFSVFFLLFLDTKSNIKSISQKYHLTRIAQSRSNFLCKVARWARYDFPGFFFSLSPRGKKLAAHCPLHEIRYEYKIVGTLRELLLNPEATLQYVSCV